MTILGNLFLAGTALVFLYFLFLFYGSKLPMTGDAAVGTLWSVLFVHLLLLGGLTAAALAVIWNGGFDSASENAGRRVEGLQQDAERWKNENLAQIEATDAASFEVAHILSFTTIHQDATVRQRALEKIKSNPDWQRHLIDLAERGASVELFEFLAYNEVEDKALFAEPVRRAALSVAEHFRETIRRATHPAHFYPQQFSYETERVLLTLERFTGSGVDYRPAVRALRAALDEPSKHKTIRFKVERELDRWLRKHA